MKQYDIIVVGAGAAGVFMSYEMAKLGINGIDTNFWKFYSDPTWYTKARNHKMSVNAWTVDEKEHLRTLILLGVDYITTNHPEICRELLQEMGIEELKAGKNFK